MSDDDEIAKAFADTIFWGSGFTRVTADGIKHIPRSEVMMFPRLMMGIEPKEEKDTAIIDPSEARRRIFEASHESALIRNVLMSADYSGLSSEDRYTMLAYHS